MGRYVNEKMISQKTVGNDIRNVRQVLQIPNEQLAFTPDETRLFFQTSTGWFLSDRQCDRIQRACEGWIGGMVLLNQTLQRLDQSERDRYLKQLPSRYMSTQTVRFSMKYFYRHRVRSGRKCR